MCAPLDCGCGAGENAAHIVRETLARGVVGFDVSPDAVAAAEARVAAFRRKGGIDDTTTAAADGDRGGGGGGGAEDPKVVLRKGAPLASFAVASCTDMAGAGGPVRRRFDAMVKERAAIDGGTTPATTTSTTTETTTTTTTTTTTSASFLSPMFCCFVAWFFVGECGLLLLCGHCG